MQTLSATDIKRRGIVAIEELLDEGPVHIIKNNHLTCVVLTEEDYARFKLLARKYEPIGLNKLLRKSATGKSTP